MIPKLQITEKGYLAPTTKEINAGVWRMLQDVMGENLSTVQGTVQYQLATSITAIIKDRDDHSIELANQYDPRYADGIYQDAIGELYFMTRQLATRSVCPVTFIGLVGVTIPTGFIIRDINGNDWETTGTYNIGVSGRVTGNVMCLTAGAIEANIDSINIIPSALTGLDRVTNEVNVIAGFNEESRQAFEMRRRESVSANSKMTDDAVRGAVLGLPNVVDCFAVSNPTDATVQFGATNYNMIRNSITVSVVGGVDYDVAEMALIKAGTGCSFNGNTPVTVYSREHPINPPPYDIKILRPDIVPLHFKVTVVDISLVSVNEKNSIQQAIIDYIKSMRITQTIIPSAIICKIGVEVIQIEVSLDGADWKSIQKMGIDQYPTTDEFKISIVQA